MKNKKDNVDLILDEYEEELEASVPEDLVIREAPKEVVDTFVAIAKRHKELKRSKRINIRINNQDLAKVKAKANKSNIPYQTLLSTLVHKYAEGDLSIKL